MVLEFGVRVWFWLDFAFGVCFCLDLVLVLGCDFVCFDVGLICCFGLGLVLGCFAFGFGGGFGGLDLFGLVFVCFEFVCWLVVG